jgi:hypothetical protein
MAQTIGITWEQEVFARGELRATRADLRAFLEERFGQLPEVLVQRIENTDDLERLKSGIRQGAKINALDQLVL